MKKKNIPVEFVYQLFALIIAIIIVHAFYVSVVRPTAAQVIEEQNMQAQADPDFVRERSRLGSDQGPGAGILFYPDVLGAGDHGLQSRQDWQ